VQIIMSVDPSAEHSGLVLFQQAGNGGPLEAVDAATLPVWDVMHWVAGSGFPPPSLLLIERPASGPRLAGQDGGRTIAAYWYLIWRAREFLPPRYEVRSIGPGAWKPAARRIVRDFPTILKTQHERDAYAMGVVTLAGRKSPNG
jgi:hypothetical protein